MKKFLLVLFVTCAVAVSSFAAFQYNAGSYYGIPTGAFSFDSDMSIVMNVNLASLKGFGYYNVTDGVQVAGNLETGALGNFKAGDQIGIWMQDLRGDVFTSTLTSSNEFVGAQKSGDSYLLYSGPSIGVGRDAWQYSLSDAGGPSGQPLPGIIATLLLGGGVTAGLKLRKREKSN